MRSFTVRLGVLQELYEKDTKALQFQIDAREEELGSVHEALKENVK